MSDSNTLREAMQRFAKAHKAYRDSPSSDRWESLCEAGTELDQETRYVALSSQAEPQASTPAGLTDERIVAIWNDLAGYDFTAETAKGADVIAFARAILNTEKP